MEPLITIVTPSYNQGQFIEATIQSVLNQTYKNIQYILVDGGSTDNTMAVVEKYRDQIDIIIHEKDKGQSDAINKGFKLAKGELVGWINSDDILYPDCAEIIAKLYSKNPEGVIFYGSIIDRINEKGDLIFKRTSIIPDKKHLLDVNYDVVQQGSFYNTKAVKKVDYINENIYYCMDLDLWLRLLDLGPIFSFDDRPIAGFRSWGETKTSLGAAKFLKDIEGTILRHGARRISKNMVRLNFILSKIHLKKLIVKKK